MENLGLEGMVQKLYDDTLRASRVMEKYAEYTVHPFARGSLTTSGVQYTNVTSGSTASSASYFIVDAAATVSPVAAGRDADDLDEIELGLTAEFKKDTTAAAASSLGYQWQIKGNANTTWTALCSTKQIVATTAFVARTLSGYFTNSGTNYKTLPVDIRLVMMNKTKGSGLARIKSSSYVKIKAKHS